ncbi:HAMP domain-containing histidine kinase [Collinsella sp. zg1085]|uniref:sensor histidine kinase n=1 Tax=Collinsella sp. zg1085 TaxID=2844380 RepID=UPI001C0C92D6|nr:HAMP domain-containing sensor histidine kinase [Collinsella sp. zg1085]QWT17544.1 HAMP domain-containing histidine kinase [Collinsella sp. zg1085]
MLPAQFAFGQQRKKDSEASSRATWNTPRSDSRRGGSYAARMAASFALTSFMTVLITVLVVTVVWGGVFSEYTRANVEEIVRLTSKKLVNDYEQAGKWSTKALDDMATSGIISEDIGMQVLDVDGTVLYDDTWPAAAIAAEIKREESQDAVSSGASTTPESFVPSRDASLANHGLVSKAPTDTEGAISQAIVASDGTTIGTLRMWVLGSDALLTKADSAFREKTFNAMAMAALVAVAISLVIGLLVSRRLTDPIQRIAGTAKQIRDGDLTARTGMRGDDEMDRLGETFDEMAVSLEKDLKHERRLTSDVAHELRTPLMAMLATVEAMQDGVYPTDYEHLETVAAETRRMSRLVQQMLDLSRNELKSAPINVKPVDAVGFIRSVVESQQQLFRQRNIHLRFADETQGKHASFEIDADMVTQAIINIMSNAMRYTPEGGWVVVSVLADRREVQIAVSDTGIGIAKEDLSRIFGRFWRADASRARIAGGLGVGLAVTKQIIERHHGYIAVDSELGKGSTFTIHLPREQDTHQDA